MNRFVSPASVTLGVAVTIGFLVAHQLSAAGPVTDAQQPRVRPQFEMASRAELLEAAFHGNSGDPTPPFDAVRLQRLTGTQVVECGAFPRPAISDDGSARHWLYETTRPRSGPCASLSGSRYIAVGVKGNTESKTAPVP